MATWWASVSRRCETLFGDLSKRKLQLIQNKDLEVDHEQSFLFEVKPGRRQGTCMCTYQATLSECNSYFHTPATTTPSQTPVYRMSLCYTGTRGKTPEHNQAKHTKHPHSLEWHNSTITIVFPSTLRKFGRKFGRSYSMYFSISLYQFQAISVDFRCVTGDRYREVPLHSA